MLTEVLLEQLIKGLKREKVRSDISNSHSLIEGHKYYEDGRVLFSQLLIFLSLIHSHSFSLYRVEETFRRFFSVSKTFLGLSNDSSNWFKTIYYLMCLF